MKAQSNWEEKSQYLLREIVKYDLYIDSLQAAMSLRLKKRGEKGTHSYFQNFIASNFFLLFQPWSVPSAIPIQLTNHFPAQVNGRAQRNFPSRRKLSQARQVPPQGNNFR